MNNYKKVFMIPLVIAIVALLCVGGGAYIYFNKSTTTTSISLKKLSLVDLMKLNKQIECDTVNLLEKSMLDRKDNNGMEVPLKFFINGNTIREEGLSVMTDGNILKDEKGVYLKTINIINTENKTYHSLMLDGSKQMSALSKHITDWDEILKSLEKISPEFLDCKFSVFDEKILIPDNICYIDSSMGTPICKISNFNKN